MVRGSSFSFITDAFVLGRSTGTPTVSMGAVIIKITSNTNMTSTMGVTLISETRRALRRDPVARALLREKAILVSFVKLARNDRSKFIREGIKTVGIPVELEGELIIGNHGGDSSDKA